jgi:hypothetical protein
MEPTRLRNSLIELLRLFILCDSYSAIGVPVSILTAFGFLRDSNRLLNADRETTLQFHFRNNFVIEIFLTVGRRAHQPLWKYV